jgi:hypothetical protein
MYFYDAESIQRELGPHGELELSELDEPAGNGAFPFINVVCKAA